ncbi:MAG TPA: hypothetical protein VHN99_09010, partial [Deinococcales bacterium]|nr:hypothetical protein [Deinococcales bacterium]
MQPQSDGSNIALDSLGLAGEWRFALDPRQVGKRDRWFAGSLPETIALPGSTDVAGLGYETTERHNAFLTRVREYVGPAWYQRTLNIPDDWAGKRVTLFLERCHWATTAWVGERQVGRQDSLCAPHVHDLGVLSPGEHTLTLCVDNTVRVAVGDANAWQGHHDYAHSISDHTQTNWNGIVGRIELQARDAVSIEGVDLFPDLSTRTVRARVRVRNDRPDTAQGVLTLGGPLAREMAVECSLSPGRNSVEATCEFPPDAATWDEFEPAIHSLVVSLETNDGSRDRTSVNFGFRDFRADGTQFSLNGRKTFLRGALDCCVFPQTGFPPMDAPAWERYLAIFVAHGLNHVRFHSWCPPEAAFDAADRLGLIVQVEAPVWAELGSDPAIDSFVLAETERIVESYGNHPSFCLLAAGNEASGPQMGNFLASFVSSWRARDNRRLYTTCSGWPMLPESDYHSTPEPRIHRWGEGLNSRVNREPLSTLSDYRDWVARHDRPIVTHEIGEWCVFPDIEESARYTGVTRARNLDLVRVSLAANHLLDHAGAFHRASGRLQLQLYKEEVEAQLRTPGLGGFQLLGLLDFPGQGTATIGVVNALGEEKPYAGSKRFRQFCSETVALLRAPSFTMTTADTFRPTIEVAHYGPKDLIDPIVNWRLEDTSGNRLAEGALRP